MKLDVAIYLNNVVKFFNENPTHLQNFVSLDKKEIFFDKIKEVASYNAEKGDEVTLTQKQFIDICLEINGKKEEPQEVLTDDFTKTHKETKWGYICWN
jgi:hypothetical protein